LEARENKISVAIIGASGYTGLELIKLVHAHPFFDLRYVATSEGGTSVAKLHPSLDGVVDLPVEKADVTQANAMDLVFLALPHKTAFSFAKDLTTKVVDLSADYRLQMPTYEKYYCPHGDKAGASAYCYGLVEHYRDVLKQSSKVAVPGCYPTASLLGLLPFIDAIQKDSPVFIDAKSGVSGAGKKCVETTHFCKDNENSFAYAPLNHRHAPEIAEKSNIDLSRIHFVPQIIPATRGMIANIYLQVTPCDAKEMIANFYKDEQFIRIKDEPVELKNVAGTHFCDIFVAQKDNVVFIASAIDNLLRGASSQALACANLICGLDENIGLPRLAYVP
jgi:N-acetyl-gamma-glutamyl-phosphate reductase